jgi:3-hydroxybutyryl-CoA dehydrogenase
VPVRLIDTSQASIDKGLKFADKLLAKDVSKGRLSQADADAARERLSSSTKMEDLSDVDFVIEAVPVGSRNKGSRERDLTTRRKSQS